MKILVRFNKNIAIPRQVKSFKLFDLGIVSTTIDDLLDSTTIEIDDQTLPILKINNSSFIEYYLINDLGLTPGYSYPYYTDDFMKEVTIGDLVLINNGQMGEENIQSDWNQINILADDFIKNKPELFSGDYNDLINTPALVTNHSELNLDDGTNPHGTTKADVGLSNVDNTSDVNKPISSATQTALNLKLDSASFTKSGIGLGNVDNTSDLNKPISTATQTILNKKMEWLVKDTTPTTAVTGTTSLTQIGSSILIPANTFSAYAVMILEGFGLDRLTTFGTVTFRLFHNTTNSLTGATALSVSIMSQYNLTALARRTFEIGGGLLKCRFGTGSSAFVDLAGANLSPLSISFNPAIDNYFFTTVQLSNASDSVVRTQLLISK